MKDDQVYLNQILEAITKIETFTTGLSRDQFLVDGKTQSAVIMPLMLIGELAKKVSLPTKDRIDLPWKDIVGFRDRAIHDYFNVDLDIVWSTTISDLPEIKNKLT